MGEWAGGRASEESGADDDSSISVDVSFGVGSSTTCGRVRWRVEWDGVGRTQGLAAG